MNNDAIEIAKKLGEDQVANQQAERAAGMKLALNLGAGKTLATIKDPNSCYEDILTTAQFELGLDKFAAAILQSDPFWAHKTLLHVPDLGSYRDAIIKKAAETPESALHTLRHVDDLGEHHAMLMASTGGLGQTLGSISGFELFDDGGYNCEFTMYWTNDAKIQPAAGTTDHSKWKWSEKILLGQSTSNICSYFALPDSPLQAGNEVWMYMWVQAGDDIESPLRFTYDPNTANKAHFVASGPTKSTKLGFTGIYP